MLVKASGDMITAMLTSAAISPCNSPCRSSLTLFDNSACTAGWPDAAETQQRNHRHHDPALPGDTDHEIGERVERAGQNERTALAEFFHRRARDRGLRQRMQTHRTR